MTCFIASKYYVEGEPIQTILGATGVAYGWMLKKYMTSESQAKEFDEDETGGDWTFTRDDRSGIHFSGDSHDHYRSFSKKFHHKDFHHKTHQPVIDRIESDKFTKSHGKVRKSELNPKDKRSEV